MEKLSGNKPHIYTYTLQWNMWQRQGRCPCQDTESATAPCRDKESAQAALSTAKMQCEHKDLDQTRQAELVTQSVA